MELCKSESRAKGQHVQFAGTRENQPVVDHEKFDTEGSATIFVNQIVIWLVIIIMIFKAWQAIKSIKEKPICWRIPLGYQTIAKRKHNYSNSFSH